MPSPRSRDLAHHAHAVDRRGLVLADAVSGQCDERVLQGAAAGLLPQRRSGPLGGDPAVVDDRDAIGDALRLLHVVRGEKHRHLLVAAERAHEFPNLVAGLRVEPAWPARRGTGCAAGAAARRRFRRAVCADSAPSHPNPERRGSTQIGPWRVEHNVRDERSYKSPPLRSIHARLASAIESAPVDK
jgi:hypothetical protein